MSQNRLGFVNSKNPLLLPWCSAFYRASSYASAVLAVIVLSVRLSVRPSHACFVPKPNNALLIFWYHELTRSTCHCWATCCFYISPQTISPIVSFHINHDTAVLIFVGDNVDIVIVQAEKVNKWQWRIQD